MVNGIPETTAEMQAAKMKAIENAKAEKSKNEVHPIIRRLTEELDKTGNPIALHIGLAAARIFVLSYYILLCPVHLIIGIFKAMKKP